MNFTKDIRPQPERGERPAPFRAVPARSLARIAMLVGGLAMLASVAAAPAVAPYHGGLRAVYITLAPLTVGYLWGALDHTWMRRHLVPVLAATALVFVAALAPRLRTDVAPAAVLGALASGVAVGVVLLRIGLLQAGIGWRAHTGNEETDFAPRWAAVFATLFAWLWLAAALLNPREDFLPTRWLLTVTGNPPPAAARATARVQLDRYALSDAAIAPERGLVVVNGYGFRVGPLTPGPGGLQAAVSVRPEDGRPFGRPVWLTLDADDAARPDSSNDLQYYDVGSLASASPEAKATRDAAGSAQLTAYAWYDLNQSLPAVRLRARLWTFESESDGRIRFEPLAEANLGRWDLTLLRRLRPQPTR
jgi:hypothetical protein